MAPGSDPEHERDWREEVARYQELDVEYQALRILKHIRPDPQPARLLSLVEAVHGSPARKLSRLRFASACLEQRRDHFGLKVDRVRRALTEDYLRSFWDLVSYLISQGMPRDQAQDDAQDVLIKLWIQPDRVKEQRGRQRLLNKMGRNCAIDRMRTRRREQLVEDMSVFEGRRDMHVDQPADRWVIFRSAPEIVVAIKVVLQMVERQKGAEKPEEGRIWREAMYQCLMTMTQRDAGRVLVSRGLYPSVGAADVPVCRMKKKCNDVLEAFGFHLVPACERVYGAELLLEVLDQYDEPKVRVYYRATCDMGRVGRLLDLDVPLTVVLGDREQNGYRRRVQLVFDGNRIGWVCEVTTRRRR